MSKAEWITSLPLLCSPMGFYSFGPRRVDKNGNLKTKTEMH
jgi:hypothetical protein